MYSLDDLFRAGRITLVAVIFTLLGGMPHAAHAAVTYDFNSDTIGQTPANVTVTAGTFDVQNDVTLGNALRAETQVGVIAGVIFNAFASSTDQSVIWKQSYSDSMARGGFTLRAQSTDTSVVNSVGARMGYLFHVYDSGSVYIWKVGSASYTALWSGSLAKAQPRWFKAIAQGTALGFYYSDDGSNYTLLASTTDSTYTSGVVQYTAGYGLAVAKDSIDDVVITNLGTPDITAPSVSLTAPVASTTVHGATVALSATATDDSAVAGVKFYVDGALQGSEDTAFPYTVSWNSTATSSGTHTGFAVARDTSNNYATSSAVSFTVDNTAPVLSAAAVGTLDTGARLSWLSDEAASSQVNFGLTASYGSSTPEIDTGTRLTGHVVDIAGLASCTQYHYQLQGADASGNIGTSSVDATFTTSGCATAASPSTRSRRPGGTIQGQVQNLISMGNLQAANALKSEWPALFTPAATASVVSPVRDLRRGSVGEDVRALQKILNAKGFSVAAKGPGSVGQETTTFGTMTQSALAAYQKANGIVPAGGYFGSITRAQMKTAGAAGLWW